MSDQRMRYQVRIIQMHTEGRWWRRPKAVHVFNYGSSRTFDAALVLFKLAPFYIGEFVVIDDVHEGEWVAIKRGRTA